MLGSRDLPIGTIANCPCYISADTFSYYKNSAMTIDVTKGRGASFSLESPLACAF
ncbi:DUF779 domain-containing protein [Coraliomargarita sp. W4R53]